MSDRSTRGLFPDDQERHEASQRLAQRFVDEVVPSLFAELKDRLPELSVPELLHARQLVDEIDALLRSHLAYLERTAETMMAVLPAAWFTLLDRSQSEAEQEQAAEAVAAAIERGAVSTRRRAAHPEFEQALRDEADRTGRTTAAVLRVAVRDAIRFVAFNAQQPQPVVRLRRDGILRAYRRGFEGRASIVPIEDLPLDTFATWIRAQISNEVFEALLPGWRDSERGRETSLDELTEARGRAASALESDARADDPAQSIEHAEDRRRRQALLEVLRSVATAEDLTIATLRTLERQTSAEVGATLGLPAGTVRRRMHQLRRRLEEARPKGE